MNSYVDKCCIELYNASVDRNDKHGDYVALKKEFGDEIPFEKYYIPEYQLISIIKKHIADLPDDNSELIKDFVNEVFRLSPTTNYSVWLNS